MTRVLAVVGAALLIGVAVLVRGILEDDDGATADDGGDEPADLVVACIPELVEVCNELDTAELRIEDPEETIANAEDVDAWVTLDPWPEIAGFGDAPSGLTNGQLAAASTPLVIAARTDRLPDGCAPDWNCLAVGGNDGPELPLVTTALGRLALGHAAEEWRVVTDAGPSLTTAEIELPAFGAWLDGIAFDRDPLGDMFAFAPAGPLATAVTAVRFVDDVEGSREDGRIESFPGAVPATIVAVVTGRAAESIREPLQSALVDAGWNQAQPDARSSGLPSAGVLFALAQEVS
jgi:hypothetical protein